MSRSAALAAVATREALEEARWTTERESVGFYLGVGASGGEVDQLVAMLGASIADYEFSLSRFGDAGLRACNPLFAFQLMQNFTLCHSAIVHGLAGPNAAYYSRGAGTVTALYEAAHAVLEGECSRALSGGADSAVHAVTFAELVREGFAARGLVPGEGAAVFALGDVAAGGAALAFLEHVSVLAGAGTDVDAALAEGGWTADCAEVDAVVLAPWGPPARDALSSFVGVQWPGRPVLDASLSFGEALAAGPSLAWGLGVDLLREERLRRVLILSAGLDGDVGVVVLRSGAAA
jgi:hypothetical protein